MFSNSNISLSWESNENVTWKCSLVVNSTTSSVNCSGANWRGYNLSEGRYELIITATDDAGNVATFVHMFNVDLTPPTVTITDGPPFLTNEITSTLYNLHNNESLNCSYYCQLYSNSMNVLVLSVTCDGGILTTPSLETNNYTLSVIATDYVGNTGQPTNYHWETDLISPLIFGVDNASTQCSTTNPDATGQPQATDQRTTNPSLNYSDISLGCSIERTWLAADEAGNVAILIQYIHLEYLPSISLLPVVAFPCANSSNSTEETNDTISTPNPCGFPLHISYEDSTIVHVCPSEFVRNWTVNTCNNTATQSQSIVLYNPCLPNQCGRNESTPRGVCSFGECQCNRPWFGENCGILIHEQLLI